MATPAEPADVDEEVVLLDMIVSVDPKVGGRIDGGGSFGKEGGGKIDCARDDVDDNEEVLL